MIWVRSVRSASGFRRCLSPHPPYPPHKWDGRGGQGLGRVYPMYVVVGPCSSTRPPDGGVVRDVPPHPQLALRMGGSFGMGGCTVYTWGKSRNISRIPEGTPFLPRDCGVYPPPRMRGVGPTSYIRIFGMIWAYGILGYLHRGVCPSAARQVKATAQSPRGGISLKSES